MMGRTAAMTVVLAGLALPALAQDTPWDAPVDGPAPADDGGTPPAADPPPASGTPDAPASTTRLTPEELAARRERSQQNKELLTVEQNVSTLKERVFRSKATLQLLRELIIDNATVGSRVSLWHVDKLSSAYTVESLQYFVDGKVVFSRSDTTGALDDLDVVEIHTQALPPGSHSLRVNMVLRGNGLGVFSYLRAYSFKVQSSYAFTVEDGKITTVQVKLDEKGGPFASFVDRPNVSYEENLEDLRGE